MNSARYLAALAIGVLLWCGLLVGVVWLIDPYGVAPLRTRIPGINEVKPSRVNIDRVLKPYEVWRYRPRTVFLGSSRIQQGLDPADLDGTSLAPAYNASIPASTLSENAAHLKQFFELDPNLKIVVVELFFSNFIFPNDDAAGKTLGDFAASALALHFSATALADAVRTVFANRQRTYDGPSLAEGGNWRPPTTPYAQGSFAGFIDAIMAIHKNHLDLELQPTVFAALDRVVHICRERGARLYLVIAPQHPYDDYRWLSLGYWSLLEAWYRRLAEYPDVVSFAQYHGPLEEPIKERMDYWYDPIHFSSKMGRMMLRSLAGKHEPDIPENMLVRIDAASAQSAITERRKGVEEWMRKNPGFVAQFEVAKIATGNDEVTRRWARKHPELAAKRAAARERDRVAESLAALTDLQGSMNERYPADAITEYRNATRDLAAAGALPQSLLRDGKAENAWGGPFHAQIFPAGAWRAGVGATHNYVFEGVNRSDCVRLIEALSRRSPPKPFRINLVPSGKIHETFPVSGGDGCSEGVNSVGYTVIAG
jgi:hypothetical protein